MDRQLERHLNAITCVVCLLTGFVLFGAASGEFAGRVMLGGFFGLALYVVLYAYVIGVFADVTLT